jgi:hypothetical protein
MDRDAGQRADEQTHKPRQIRTTANEVGGGSSTYAKRLSFIPAPHLSLA